MATKTANLKVPATKTQPSVTSRQKLNGKAVNMKNMKSKKQKSLDDLLVDNLLDIYDAEQQLVEAIPDMAEACYNEDLQDAMNKHLQQTKRHVERLDKVFKRLRIEKSDVVKCEAMEGLINEAKEIMKDYEESPVRDSALIIAAQKIEHYEIASYGSICELCDVLGHHQVGDILGRSLDEEETTDEELTSIAQVINDEACEMSEGASEEEEDFV